MKSGVQCWFLVRAVFLRDFLDGDAYLVAQVPPSVHHAIRPFTQNHLVAVLIGLIDVLQREMRRMQRLKAGASEEFHMQTQAEEERRVREQMFHSGASDSNSRNK